MGPAAATQFYTVDNATGGAGGLFNWVQQTGNPNLMSETADTWTFGFVMNSPFEAEWLSGMTLSFDYYKVEIEDAIMLYSVDYANFRCYGSTHRRERGRGRSAGCDAGLSCCCREIQRSVGR